MIFFLIICLLITSAVPYAEDYSFDIPPLEAQKENLEFSGNFEAKYSILKSRKQAPLYKLQYYNQQLSETLSSSRLAFYLNGDYQTKDMGVHLKTYAEYYNDNQTDFKLFELYGNINLAANSFLTVGKKRYNWGKGYAFNPVGYVNPEKDPENPELSQAGISSLNYEYSKSFQKLVINNISLDLIVIPSAETINNKVSEIESTDTAGKLYFLVWDTDIDLMFYNSIVNAEKYGFDFSRNILPSLEAHGELSHFRNQPKYLISQNQPETEKREGVSYLLGIRWLNEWNVTSILEFYHNDAGLKRKEFADYNEFLLNAAASENEKIISNAIGVNKKYFNSPNLMQDYLYLKLSWPEPFNWVYFTPSAYMLVNLVDESQTIGVPLSYKPITNFEFILTPTFLVGNQDTEYGSKQYENRIEFWTMFYF